LALCETDRTSAHRSLSQVPVLRLRPSIRLEVGNGTRHWAVAGKSEERGQSCRGADPGAQLLPGAKGAVHREGASRALHGIDRFGHPGPAERAPTL